MKKVIEGNIYLGFMHLTKLPDFLGEVDEVKNGYLSIDVNNLTDLTNCPRVIDGYFSARKTRLKSLKGGPRIVMGDFGISSNDLTDLEHSPDEVHGVYDCRLNFNLKTLRGCPDELERLDASYCDLRTLIGGPTIMRKRDYTPFYIVAGNPNLTSLEGAPTEIPGNFNAYGCGLKDLRGAPAIVRLSFSVGENPLESLEGCPKVVGGDFICYPKGSEKDRSLQTFTEEQIRAVCDVRGRVRVKRSPINLDII